MADITGTNANDVLTLTTTFGQDTINALGGNDKIISIGGFGSSLIDGGAGYDTVDYSSLPGTLLVDFFRFPVDGYVTILRDQNGAQIGDGLRNIEAIIGSKAVDNKIVTGSSIVKTADLDLSKNKFTYSSFNDPFTQVLTTKVLTVKNFTQFFNSGNQEIRFTGNDSNNVFGSGEGNNVVIASKGNDKVFTSPFGGTTTVDYSNLGRAIKFAPIGSVATTGNTSVYAINDVKIDKNGFGIDELPNINAGVEKILGITKIIGAANKANTLDASTANSSASIDVNLANNLLKTIGQDTTINFSNGINEFTLVNFVDVIGSKYDDKIVGANKNSKLTGGGGNDIITGGSKNDRITGTDSTARGIGEVDTLTGGGGRDKFVLGDKNGAYYVGKGKDDYATITDFNLFQDSIDLGSFKDYSFGSGGNNTIELFAGKNAATRDLIAKIKISGFSGSGLSNGASSKMAIVSGDPSMPVTAGSNSGLGSLAGQINILSGANSTADPLV
jgi:RTX calcium-binding nonapeptide repeat (4 copies)